MVVFCSYDFDTYPLPGGKGPEGEVCSEHE
jgi:hypothetical protein